MSDPRQVPPPHEGLAGSERCGHSWRDLRDPDCPVARAARIALAVLVVAVLVVVLVWST